MVRYHADYEPDASGIRVRTVTVTVLDDSERTDSTMKKFTLGESNQVEWNGASNSVFVAYKRPNVMSLATIRDW
jgi:hypothetical protein